MSLTATRTCQLAAWVDRPHHGAHLRIRDDVDIPSPKDGEVLVKLDYTGVCHSDVHSIYGETPMSTNIAGHEGVGHVVDLGPNVEASFLNLRVGIKWIFSTCRKCEICSVNPTACPNQHNSGRDVPGTFQQYVVSAAEDVTVVPDALESALVAPLLCAGLTMYSAITKTKLRKGDWLVLPGAGGGLGHIGIQIAAKRGYKVIAIDKGDSKRKMCLDLGATAFLDFSSDEIEVEVEKLTSGYGAHALICTAGSESAYKQAPKLLRNLGVLVCVGLPRMDFGLPITPFEMVVRGLVVVGTSVGTPSEMEELFQMAVAGDVVPRLEIFRFEEIDKVVERLAKFEIDGRVVLKIP